MDKKEQQINPLAAGIIGAVAGAAVVALSSKETRKVVGEHFDKLKNQTSDAIKKLNEDTKEYSKDVKSDVQEDLKNAVENEKPKMKKYV